MSIVEDSNKLDEGFHINEPRMSVTKTRGTLTLSSLVDIVNKWWNRPTIER